MALPNKGPSNPLILRSNGVYKQPHLITVQNLSTEVYTASHVPQFAVAEAVVQYTGTPAAATPRTHKGPIRITQSERDWAYAKRALTRGADPQTSSTPSLPFAQINRIRNTMPSSLFKRRGLRSSNRTARGPRRPRDSLSAWGSSPMRDVHQPPASSMTDETACPHAEDRPVWAMEARWALNRAPLPPGSWLCLSGHELPARPARSSLRMVSALHSCMTSPYSEPRRGDRPGSVGPFLRPPADSPQLSSPKHWRIPLMNYHLPWSTFSRLSPPIGQDGVRRLPNRLFAPAQVYLISRQRFSHAPRPFFPPRPAWYSLGLKPCARRLRPFCFAHPSRALRVSAPPPIFQISRKPGSIKSCRSPEKARPQV
jgi:hypothetical protein